MHPGNILVRVTRSKLPSKQLFRLKPHVVFLDVNMTAELSKRDQLNLVEFFKAVALRDGRSVAECTLRLSAQQNCPNPSDFIEVNCLFLLSKLKTFTLVTFFLFRKKFILFNPKEKLFIHCLIH